MLVATKRAPSRTARDARSRPSKSKSRWKPTTTASAGGSRTTRKPAVSSASTTPGPAHASTRAPRASEALSSSAAASALVNTAAGSAAIPAPVSLVTTSPTVWLELFDRNTTPSPAERKVATASAAPGTDWLPRHTTPSRSQQTTGGRPDADTSAGWLADLRQRVAVLLERAHRDGQLQVAARTIEVTDAEKREPEPEVRVVVHRVDLDRSLELGLRGGEPPAPEIGAPERLANRALLRLEIAGPLEGDRGGMRVGARQQPTAFLEGDVRVGVGVGSGLVLVHLLVESEVVGRSLGCPEERP